MPNDAGAGERSRLNPDTLDQTDRILLAGCAALWLAALGAGVAAIVALVDLGNDAVGTSAKSGTPWLLYVVIGVSALVIVAAVPLLIRARRAALDGPPLPAGTRSDEPGSVFDDPVETTNVRASAGPVIRRQPVPPPTSRVGFPTAAVEQIWLRCPVAIIGGMGAAVTLVGVATYLSATAHDTSAGVAYAVAGLVTVALPIVPLFFLRQLHDVLD